MPVLLHGGGTTAPETTRAFIRLAGGNDAPLVILSQSSADPVAQARRSADWMRENGARNVITLGSGLSPEAKPDDWEKPILAARGVWLPGGDQRRLTAYFAGTPIPSAIRKVLARGGVVGGTSAGASLMGEWMPTGDGDRTRIAQDALVTAPGLGTLRGVLVDSHFFVRERLQRLVTMIVSRPQLVGIGLDERAWAVLDPATEHLTLEAGQVALVRVVGKVTQGPEKRLGAEEVRVRLLLPGDSVNWKS